MFHRLTSCYIEMRSLKCKKKHLCSAYHGTFCFTSNYGQVVLVCTYVSGHHSGKQCDTLHFTQNVYNFNSADYFLKLCKS